MSSETNEKFNLNQRRPTGYERNWPESPELSETEEWQEISHSKKKVYTQVRSLITTETFDHIEQHEVTFDSTTVQNSDSEDYTNSRDFQNSPIKQRRPTGFNRDINLEDEEYTKTALENKEISINPTVRFKEMEQSLSDSEIKSDSLVKQRRPTGYVRKEESDNLEKQVNDKENETNSKKNEALNQRKPTGFPRKEKVTKQVNFEIKQNSDDEEKTEVVNKQLRQRRPTGFVRKKELKCLENPAPIYQPAFDNQHNDFDDHLWREMEKDVEQDFSNNIEEEFAKIRHNYELNEGDFLEKSPLNSPQQPLGFGKSIDDDWLNFENLKPPQTKETLQSPQEIKITFSDPELAATTSILKEHKLEEGVQAKPRKSKVTFDFKTDERVIPSRNHLNDLEYDINYDYYDDDVYDKPPPPIPPQPMQRLSNINYNNETSMTPIVAIPTTISLFGTQISQEENGEDSWSAIRKHRNLTVEFENLSSNSKLSSPPPCFNTPPPKPSYRNPMAQLAIQRAKEVRADMDGFRSRSINDKKPEALRRQNERVLNLNNDDNCDGTDA